MTWLHYPIVGDPVYGTKKQLVKGMDPKLASIVTSFPRQALHARAIQLLHPQNDESMSWAAPIPEDMTRLIDSLELDAKQQ
jgi:23S rRNA pseudouridine1911/1915/1917 synthase